MRHLPLLTCAPLATDAAALLLWALAPQAARKATKDAAAKEAAAAKAAAAAAAIAAQEAQSKPRSAPSGKSKKQSKKSKVVEVSTIQVLDSHLFLLLQKPFRFLWLILWFCL